MVDGEQIYGDGVNVDGAKTLPLFSQCTAIQKRLRPSTQQDAEKAPFFPHPARPA
jgi:hypothetical protein